MADKFRAIFDRQIELLSSNQTDRLVDENYTPDAELRNFDANVSGTAALKEFFKGYYAALGSVELLSTDKYVEGSDSILLEGTVKTAHGIAKVYDVFILRDGKIWRHLAGLISFTPNA